MRSMSHSKLSICFHGRKTGVKKKIITHSPSLKKKFLDSVSPGIGNRLINESEILLLHSMKLVAYLFQKTMHLFFKHFTNNIMTFLLMVGLQQIS